MTDGLEPKTGNCHALSAAVPAARHLKEHFP
jgi:hypothetical protein